MYQKPFIADHPLIQHKVSILRDVDTSSKQFRELIREITELMVYEATRDLPTCEVDVHTPIALTKAHNWHLCRSCVPVSAWWTVLWNWCPPRVSVTSVFTVTTKHSSLLNTTASCRAISSSAT